MSAFRVAPGRSLRLPVTKVKKVLGPKGFTRVGEPGRLMLPGELLPDDYVAFASTKVEGNSKTLLANLIADGAIVEV